MGRYRGQAQAYAVLRVDLFQLERESGRSLADLSIDDVRRIVSVKEVVATQEIARREVERLRALRPDGERVDYFFTPTRLFPEDESAGSKSAEGGESDPAS